MPTLRFSEDAVQPLTCSDQVQRNIHIWEPPLAVRRAVIVAIHGGLAHAGDYVTPALFFRNHDMVTVSYDLHGHDGKTRVDIPNFDVFLKDTDLFLQWVKVNYPNLPIFIMGHSMGALIATRWGLSRHHLQGKNIKGFIFSSPYYVNAVKVPKIMTVLAAPIAKLLPRMKVPMASMTHVLTHDSNIAARHLADEADHIRATEASMRFANALLVAQKNLIHDITTWRYPVFAVVAGDDHLANAHEAEAILKEINPTLLIYHFYADNYHENFNEINREHIFNDILRWMNQKMR